ncbi:MAG TPA: hypothetical protein VL727_03225 [Puia sp.]|nr:hypothetical protein [Puia sp.]
MNIIKKLLGIVWIALGPVILYWLIKTGTAEIAKNPIINTKIQWGVFIVVFIPIVVGLVLFGYYALKGEYDR